MCFELTSLTQLCPRSPHNYSVAMGTPRLSVFFLFTVFLLRFCSSQIMLITWNDNTEYTYIHTYIHTHTHKHSHVQYTHTPTHTYTHTHKHSHVQYTHTHTHTHSHNEEHSPLVLIQVFHRHPRQHKYQRGTCGGCDMDTVITHPVTHTHTVTHTHAHTPYTHCVPQPMAR